MTGSSGSTPLGRRERIDRMRTRSWVLHVLYRWESGERERPLRAVLDDILRNRRVSPRRIPSIARLVEVLGSHMDEVDHAIQAAMENWRLERLSAIDRSVLRIASAEILFVDQTPPRVAIQEGIRMAGQYGGDESPRFVNGVLDAVYRASGRAD